MVDWGASFAAAHARYFPDAPLPTVRMGIGRVALSFLLECGGSAYLPEDLVEEYLENERIFHVLDAPIIDRRVYAIYQAHGERRGFVEEALGYLKGGGSAVAAQSSSRK